MSALVLERTVVGQSQPPPLDPQAVALIAEIDRIAEATDMMHTHGRGRYAGRRTANRKKLTEAAGLKKGALDAIYEGSTDPDPRTLRRLGEWAAARGVPGYAGYAHPYRALYATLGWDENGHNNGAGSSITDRQRALLQLTDGLPDPAVDVITQLVEQAVRLHRIGD